MQTSKVARDATQRAIEWRHDVDQALQDARAQRRPLILDFSAAPM